MKTPCEGGAGLSRLRKVAPFPLDRPMRPHNYAVSRIMMTYWANFAKTGRPNGGGGLEWAHFKENAEETLVFGNDGVSIERD